MEISEEGTCAAVFKSISSETLLNEMESFLKTEMYEVILCFCLCNIMSDVVIQDETTKIVGFLEKSGVIVVDYKVKHVFPNKKELYLCNISSGFSTWRYNKEILSLGPYICLLVTFFNEVSGFFEFSRSIKGFYGSRVSDENLDRKRSIALNTLLNLIYSSDELMSALMDAKILFDKYHTKNSIDKIKRTINKSIESDTNYLPQILKELDLALNQTRVLSFYEDIYNLKELAINRIEFINNVLLGKNSNLIELCIREVRLLYSHMIKAIAECNNDKDLYMIEIDKLKKRETEIYQDFLCFSWKIDEKINTQVGLDEFEKLKNVYELYHARLLIHVLSIFTHNQVNRETDFKVAWNVMEANNIVVTPLQKLLLYSNIYSG